MERGEKREGGAKEEGEDGRVLNPSILAGSGRKGFRVNGMVRGPNGGNSSPP
jgi:hypothetical protein